MRTLYHFPLCPFSRQVRVLLKEKNLNFSLSREDFWLRNADFIKMNPAGETPVLRETTGATIVDIYAILEYINEYYGTDPFMPEEVIYKNETRRLIGWFNRKFYREVTKYMVDEKAIRLFTRAGSPRSEFIRAAKMNLAEHLKYMAALLREREFLVYDKPTVADIVAASHLSIVDFFNEIIWDHHPVVKSWYSIIKCRPSFRPLLEDKLPGFAAPTHYKLLDF